jgi:hypothetical protein
VVFTERKAFQGHSNEKNQQMGKQLQLLNILVKSQIRSDYVVDISTVLSAKAYEACEVYHEMVTKLKI